MLEGFLSKTQSDPLLFSPYVPHVCMWPWARPPLEPPLKIHTAFLCGMFAQEPGARAPDHLTSRKTESLGFVENFHAYRM